MRNLAFVTAICVLASIPPRMDNRLQAQTIDLSRVTIGVSVARMGGTDLWRVADQAVLSNFEGVPDTFSLQRSIRPGTTIGVQATFFMNPHLGITGEFMYLGLGTSTKCSVVHDDGDATLAAGCTALTNTGGPADATAFQAGLVARLATHAQVQPLFKALFGLASTPSSTTAVAADIGEQTLTVYRDTWAQMRATGTFALALATAPSQGLQVRLEARAMWIALPEITSSMATQGLYPPTRSTIRLFPSIGLGLDLALRKQRGRRY